MLFGQNAGQDEYWLIACDRTGLIAKRQCFLDFRIVQFSRWYLENFVFQEFIRWGGITADLVVKTRLCIVAIHGPSRPQFFLPVLVGKNQKSPH